MTGAGATTRGGGATTTGAAYTTAGGGVTTIGAGATGTPTTIVVRAEADGGTASGASPTTARRARAESRRERRDVIWFPSRVARRSQCPTSLDVRAGRH